MARGWTPDERVGRGQDDKESQRAGSRDKRNRDQKWISERVDQRRKQREHVRDEVVFRIRKTMYGILGKPANDGNMVQALA